MAHYDRLPTSIFVFGESFPNAYALSQDDRCMVPYPTLRKRLMRGMKPEKACLPPKTRKGTDNSKYSWWRPGLDREDLKERDKGNIERYKEERRLIKEEAYKNRRLPHHRVLMERKAFKLYKQLPWLMKNLDALRGQPVMYSYSLVRCLTRVVQAFVQNAEEELKKGGVEMPKRKSNV